MKPSEDLHMHSSHAAPPAHIFSAGSAVRPPTVSWPASAKARPSDETCKPSVHSLGSENNSALGPLQALELNKIYSPLPGQVVQQADFLDSLQGCSESVWSAAIGRLCSPVICKWLWADSTFQLLPLISAGSEWGVAWMVHSLQVRPPRTFCFPPSALLPSS